MNAMKGIKYNTMYYWVSHKGRSSHKGSSYQTWFHKQEHIPLPFTSKINQADKQTWQTMMRSLALRSMGEVQVHKRSPTHGTCETLFGKLPPQKGMVWLVPSSQSTKTAHATNVIPRSGKPRTQKNTCGIASQRLYYTVPALPHHAWWGTSAHNDTSIQITRQSQPHKGLIKGGPSTMSVAHRRARI